MSLLAVRLQQEKKEHADRLRAVRRAASELAVNNARRYKEAKKEQNRRIDEDLREIWEQERAQALNQTSSVLSEMEKRRGEGMRNAAAYASRLREEATQESIAWNAEHQLEKERFQVSLGTAQLQKEKSQMEEEMRRARKERVKMIEARRTEHVIDSGKKAQQRLAEHLQHSKENASASSGLLALNTNRSQSSSPRMDGVVQLHTKDELSYSAEKEALRHEIQKKQELERKARTLQEQQTAAKLRAKKILEEERLEQERLKLQQEQEAQMRTKLMEDALRKNEARGNFNLDYQEQEARRASGLNRRLHIEFEETFLKGVWKDGGRGPSFRPPLENSADLTAIAATSSSLNELLLLSSTNNGEKGNPTAAATTTPVALKASEEPVTLQVHQPLQSYQLEVAHIPIRSLMDELVEAVATAQQQQQQQNNRQGGSDAVPPPPRETSPVPSPLPPKMRERDVPQPSGRSTSSVSQALSAVEADEDRFLLRQNKSRHSAESADAISAAEEEEAEEAARMRSHADHSLSAADVLPELNASDISNAQRLRLQHEKYMKDLQNLRDRISNSVLLSSPPTRPTLEQLRSPLQPKSGQETSGSYGAADASVSPAIRRPPLAPSSSSASSKSRTPSSHDSSLARDTRPPQYHVDPLAGSRPGPSSAAGSRPPNRRFERLTNNHADEDEGDEEEEVVSPMSSPER